MMPLDWHRDYARRFRTMPELPHFSMSRSIASAARSHGCRVILKGLGGDEWLTGFGTYSDALADGDARALLDRLRRDTASHGLRGALERFMREGLVPFLPPRLQQGLRSLLRRNRRETHLAPPWLAAQVRERLRNRRPLAAVPVQAIRRGKAVQLGLLTGTRFAKFGVTELQNSSLGLEVRRPLWDARLIQAAIATPEYVRRRGSENKWMHRRAMAGLLPEAVLRRASKAEFSVIFDHHTRDLCRSLSMEVLPRRRQWVETVQIEAMMRQCLGEGDYPEFPKTSLQALWILYGADAVADALSPI
jgi:asparagine synthase (glutamine-hydrolysing)